jgi:Big-like domain-containing protein/immunoglobulin I-set domain protein
MKKDKTYLAAILVGCLSAFTSGAFAGTYKHITIDGSFGDWAGVPLAYTQAQDVNNVVAYKDIYIANDEDYLYVRFTIYGSPTNAFTFLQNCFLDTDNNTGTGYSAHGTGSEMLIQAGAGYQEKNGGFNEGAINNLDWAASPMGDGTEFEFRVSRHATFANDSTPVFANDSITLTLESETSGFVPTEWYPPTGGGVAYTFELPPPVLTTNLTLVGLANSSWQANASGTDLNTNWLDQAYDDSQAPWAAGMGLFGYTGTPGSYPAIQTPLSSTPNTYYFRTHFNWSSDAANIAFVVTNYLSDGAVYYLNGSEVKRVRMPTNAVTYATSASGTNSPVGHADVFGVGSGPLVIGDNILEVETHQAPASVGDMVFGLSLTAATQFPVTIENTNLPADVSVVSGQPVTFNSSVIGSGPLGYQWLKNGTNVPDATNASFTIPLVVSADAGNYSLVVTNSFSTNTTRAAQLVVTGTPVVITDPTKPADQYVVQGKPVTFNVVATGSAPVQYQWSFGATPIQDATNASYSIASVSPTNAGGYSVLVSNPVSSTNSRTAVLTVLLDKISPAVTNVSANPLQVIITFSESVDPTTATNPANYAVSGGAAVTNVVLSGNTATLALNSPLTLGTVYTLAINGATDLYGNTAHTTVSFTPTITIDGDMSDWAGIAPIYSGPSGSDGAADFKDIYMYNDANYTYFRVTLWHDIPAANGFFPKYCNMFYNTDGDSSTGYSAIGSELLQQSSSFYQEKNGAFNDGVTPVGMDYLIRPVTREVSFPADFEFRYSRKATFGGGGLIFSTNQISFFWQGQTPGFVAINTAASDGSVISYTNVAATVVPGLPLGQLAISPVPGKQVALTWDAAGTLQSSGLLTNTWTNMPAAASPFVIPASAGQQFFRLTK